MAAQGLELIAEIFVIHQFMGLIIGTIGFASMSARPATPVSIDVTSDMTNIIDITRYEI